MEGEGVIGCVRECACARAFRERKGEEAGTRTQDGSQEHDPLEGEEDV